MPYRLRASLSDVLREARKATALRVYRPPSPKDRARTGRMACGDAYSGDPKLSEGPPSPKDRARTGRMACGDAYSGDPKLSEGPLRAFAGCLLAVPIKKGQPLTFPFHPFTPHLSSLLLAFCSPLPSFRPFSLPFLLPLLNAASGCRLAGLDPFMVQILPANRRCRRNRGVEIGFITHHSSFFLPASRFLLSPSDLPPSPLAFSSQSSVLSPASHSCYHLLLRRI